MLAIACNIKLLRMALITLRHKASEHAQRIKNEIKKLRIEQSTCKGMHTVRK